MLTRSRVVLIVRLNGFSHPTNLKSSPMCNAIISNTAVKPVCRFAKHQWTLPVAILFGDRLLPLRGI